MSLKALKKNAVIHQTKKEYVEAIKLFTELIDHKDFEKVSTQEQAEYLYLYGLSLYQFFMVYREQYVKYNSDFLQFKELVSQGQAEDANPTVLEKPLYYYEAALKASLSAYNMILPLLENIKKQETLLSFAVMVLFNVIKLYQVEQQPEAYTYVQKLFELSEHYEIDELVKKLPIYIDLQKLLIDVCEKHGTALETQMLLGQIYAQYTKLYAEKSQKKVWKVCKFVQCPKAAAGASEIADEMKIIEQKLQVYKARAENE